MRACFLKLWPFSSFFSSVYTFDGQELQLLINILFLQQPAKLENVLLFKYRLQSVADSLCEGMIASACSFLFVSAQKAKRTEGGKREEEEEAE